MKKHNMKKFLLLFCMLACVFSMTACSTGTISYDSTKESAKEQKVQLGEQYMAAWANDMIQYLNDTDDATISENAEEAKTLSTIKGNKYIINQTELNAKTVEFFNSWIKTKESLGELQSIDNITCEKSDKTDELCVMSVDTTYAQRKCAFEFTIDNDWNLVSGAINPVYTTGEKLEKAVMNTILGMGTVFIVLIFISFVISQLHHVNNIGKKKEENKGSADSQGVDNAISQIVESEESEEADLTDDLELVAVITAAIAAAEGTSSNGLVVRSIKKVNKTNNWRR